MVPFSVIFLVFFIVGVGDLDNPQIQQRGVGVIHESPEKMFFKNLDFLLYSRFVNRPYGRTIILS